MIIFQICGFLLIDCSMIENKSLRLINLIWIIGSACIFSFIIFPKYILAQEFKSMSKIIEGINHVLIVFTHFVILLHSRATVNANILWYQRLKNAKEIFEDKFKIVLNFNQKCSFDVITAVLCVGFSTFCSLINIYYSVIYGKNKLINSLHYHCIKLLINIRYTQNSVRIDYFKQHIVIIKKLTEKLIFDKRQSFIIVLSGNQIEVQSTKNTLSNVKSILIFKQFHCLMYESTKILETCFGWSLLVMVSYTFIDLTSNLYWFFIAFLKIDENINEIDCILKILGSAVTVTYLILSSYKTEIKSLEQTNLAIKLYEIDKSEYSMLTKEFLIQIYNEKIEYSANDFFMVDFNLFFGVSIILKVVYYRLNSLHAVVKIRKYFILFFPDDKFNSDIYGYFNSVCIKLKVNPIYTNIQIIDIIDNLKFYITFILIFFTLI